MASEVCLRISVLYAPAPRTVDEVALTVAPPCTVLQALQQSGLLQRHPEIDHLHCAMGVWGRKVSMNHVLRDQDRVEVYRPLRVDPKVARRERFAKQGARAAGLFVKKNKAAAPGI